MWTWCAISVGRCDRLYWCIKGGTLEEVTSSFGATSNILRSSSSTSSLGAAPHLWPLAPRFLRSGGVAKSLLGIRGGRPRHAESCQSLQWLSMGDPQTPAHHLRCYCF